LKHRNNARSITSISTALLIRAASYTVSSSFFLSPTSTPSQSLDIFLCCLAGCTNKQSDVTCEKSRAFGRVLAEPPATAKSRSLQLILNYFANMSFFVSVCDDIQGEKNFISCAL